MQFRKGEHYPHPPRGPGRRRYYVSDAARRARRHNLSKSRLRSDRESLAIKLLIWQACFDNGPRESQRRLARQLGVCRSYIHKVQHQRAEAIDALTRGPRVTLDDLEEARRLTAKIRQQEPDLLGAVQSSPPRKSRTMTDDEFIAETWRRAREDQGRNVGYRGRRVLFSVPVR